MINALYLICFETNGIFFIIKNIIGFMFAAIFQTEKFFDLTGSLTFIYLTTKSYFANPNPVLRNKINTLLVLIWSFRLGTFLFVRVIRDGGDKRFNQVKKKPIKFLLFWLVQATWCVITAMPVYIINTNIEIPARSDTLTNMDFLAWFLWACGFILQVIADHQKFLFRADSKNKNKFIKHGVWAMSRYPNYFGEIVCINLFDLI